MTFLAPTGSVRVCLSGRVRLRLHEPAGEHSNTVGRHQSVMRIPRSTEQPQSAPEHSAILPLDRAPLTPLTSSLDVHLVLVGGQMGFGLIHRAQQLCFWLYGSWLFGVVIWADVPLVRVDPALLGGLDPYPFIKGLLSAWFRLHRHADLPSTLVARDDVALDGHTRDPTQVSPNQAVWRRRPGTGSGGSGSGGSIEVGSSGMVITFHTTQLQLIEMVLPLPHDRPLGCLGRLLDVGPRPNEPSLECRYRFGERWIPPPLPTLPVQPCPHASLGTAHRVAD
jgi:hypothetical protein